jgi:hypothetical protein
LEASPRLAHCRVGLLLRETATEPDSLKCVEDGLASVLALSGQRSAPAEPVLTRLELGTAMGQGQPRPLTAAHSLGKVLGGASTLATRYNVAVHAPLTLPQPARTSGGLSSGRFGGRVAVDGRLCIESEPKVRRPAGTVRSNPAA